MKFYFRKFSIIIEFDISHVIFDFLTFFFATIIISIIIEIDVSHVIFIFSIFFFVTIILFYDIYCFRYVATNQINDQRVKMFVFSFYF